MDQHQQFQNQMNHLKLPQQGVKDLINLMKSK
jgi:hypothetical protein